MGLAAASAADGEQDQLTRNSISYMTGQKLTPAQYRRLGSGLDREVDRLIHAKARLKRVNGEIYRAGRDLFVSDAALALWLSEPAPALGGRIPIVVMRTKAGRAKVTSVLKALAHGVIL